MNELHCEDESLSGAGQGALHVRTSILYGHSSIYPLRLRRFFAIPITWDILKCSLTQYEQYVSPVRATGRGLSLRRSWINM